MRFTSAADRAGLIQFRRVRGARCAAHACFAPGAVLQTCQLFTTLPSNASSPRRRPPAADEPEQQRAPCHVGTDGCNLLQRLAVPGLRRRLAKTRAAKPAAVWHGKMY